MPRDHKTKKPKLFAFLEFATKEEAQSVVNTSKRFSLYGKQLEISYALEQQRHFGSSRDQTPPRSYHRSRSRSPNRRSHLDSDMRSRLDKL
mmetsp:Transcript_10641/g.1610  ORF Transcript_10641/g.1610 Transcript_10641/m.1610 type:complete len:91 (+) Transcript_10641:122-394(+)